jgi:hypothetical protein
MASRSGRAPAETYGRAASGASDVLNFRIMRERMLRGAADCVEWGMPRRKVPHMSQLAGDQRVRRAQRGLRAQCGGRAVAAEQVGVAGDGEPAVGAQQGGDLGGLQLAVLHDQRSAGVQQAQRGRRDLVHDV